MFLFLMLEYRGGGWNAYGFEGKEFQGIVGQISIRTCFQKCYVSQWCGKKYFLPFEFSSDITTGIYEIYKLLDKHTHTPYFTRS